jgi:hypothetical protein
MKNNFLSQHMIDYIEKNGNIVSSLNILGVIHEILHEMSRAEDVPTDVLILVNYMLRALEGDISTFLGLDK